MAELADMAERVPLGSQGSKVHLESMELNLGRETWVRLGQLGSVLGMLGAILGPSFTILCLKAESVHAPNFLCGCACRRGPTSF